MKEWVSGLVVGVVLGSALAGTAQGRWKSATEILESNEVFRIGYLEGISDTLPVITASNTTDSIEIRFWQRQEASLDTHSKNTAGEFLRWADRIWQSSLDKGLGHDNAAAYVLLGACK